MTVLHASPVAPDAPAAPELVAAALAAVAIAAYLVGLLHVHKRGDSWPAVRGLCFTLGGASVVGAALLPLPGSELTGHMVQHLLIGMVGPLLLVLGRPVTLALRALSPGRTRTALLGLAHSRLLGWLTFPPAAAVLDLGGLWVLYRTPLFAATEEHAWLHAAVHAHVLAAGVLFTFSVCQLDPVRHRHGLVLRGGSLVLAAAAHGVLAKSLYVTPPPGTVFTGHDLARAAEVMYYGGDVVEIALAAVLAWQWYAAQGRLLHHAHRRVDMEA